MRIRPVGEQALLLDLTAPAPASASEAVPEAALVEAWRAELWRRREHGDLHAVEIVPAASTLLLDGLRDPAATAALLTSWAPTVAAIATAGTATTGTATATAVTTTAGTATATTTATTTAGTATAATAGTATASTATDRPGGDQSGGGRTVDGRPGGDRSGGVEVVVPVEFDGPDLTVVAEHWSVDVPAVLRRLTGTRFRVAFCGFAPGFPYLTGLPAELALPRLSTPRPRVPAGSVALAGPYAGIYPSASPGGWLLVGRTDLTLFDVHDDPPARLSPGTLVRLAAA
ncbi:5-oxoprolinase subunit B family protein [Micromonospora sp. DT41]|uniref:5-oxoprolinase subunit B family protein n=1 Tax=Micromonospora sp. DT41 TaxID=3393437 RepID=UPI003CF527D1